MEIQKAENNESSNTEPNTLLRKLPFDDDLRKTIEPLLSDEDVGPTVDRNIRRVSRLLKEANATESLDASVADGVAVMLKDPTALMTLEKFCDTYAANCDAPTLLLLLGYSEPQSLVDLTKESDNALKILLKKYPAQVKGYTLKDLFEIQPDVVRQAIAAGEQEGRGIQNLSQVKNATDMRQMFPNLTLSNLYETLGAYGIEPENISRQVVESMYPAFHNVIRKKYPNTKEVITKGTWRYSEEMNNMTEEESERLLLDIFNNAKSTASVNSVLSGIVTRNFDARKDRYGRIETTYLFNVQKFVGDPAFNAMVESAGHIPKHMLATQPELPVHIGRLLHSKEAAVSKKSVTEAIAELKSVRLERGKLPVFGPGRNVTVISNNERMYKSGKTVTLDGVLQEMRFDSLKSKAANKPYDAKSTLKKFSEIDRFGTEEFLRLIRKSGSVISETIEPPYFIEGFGTDSPRFHTEDEMKKNAEKKKEETLNAIRTAPPPHTFVFDGHGGKQAFWLFAGQVGSEEVESANEPAAIQYKEFAKAMRQRYQKFKDVPQSLDEDTYVFFACLSTNLSLSLQKELHDTPYHPTVIAAAEYGNYGYSNMANESKNAYIDTVFFPQGNTGKAVTVNDVIDRQGAAFSNISVFVFGKNKSEDTQIQNILQQIGKSEEAKGEGNVEV